VGEQIRLGYSVAEAEGANEISTACPILLDDLLGKRIGVDGLVERVRGSLLSSRADQ